MLDRLCAATRKTDLKIKISATNTDGSKEGRVGYTPGNNDGSDNRVPKKCGGQGGIGKAWSRKVKMAKMMVDQNSTWFFFKKCRGTHNTNWKAFQTWLLPIKGTS